MIGKLYSPKESGYKPTKKERITQLTGIIKNQKGERDFWTKLIKRTRKESPKSHRIKEMVKERNEYNKALAENRAKLNRLKRRK